jgi:hypothetical protein
MTVPDSLAKLPKQFYVDSLKFSVRNPTNGGEQAANPEFSTG